QTYENPFLGRTTVPPPGTAVPGTLPGAYDPNAATAPLFNPNTSAPAAAPPATLTPGAPAGTPPGTLPQYEPAGGFDFRQSQVPAAGATQFGTPAAPLNPAPPAYQPGVISSPSQARWGQPAAANNPSPLASGVAQHDSSTGPLSQASAVLPMDRRTAAPANSAFVGEGEAATSSAGAAPRLTEPGLLPDTSGAVDIMSLPPAGGAKAAATAGTTVERTSYLRGATATSPATPAAPTVDPANFGHDANYAQLKGRLEYSNISRQWKLRYIPIDGQTDEHGGSVILPDSSLLVGFASGDYVTVQGTLGNRRAGGFAPEYHVQRIRRLTP
ncbi:MAG: hypothetical protein JNG90_05280, partial [Planctomycetaceae bacterium]|nr:hypothetical protein [Planctomycetaceae bacterium]